MEKQYLTTVFPKKDIHFLHNQALLEQREKTLIEIFEVLRTSSVLGKKSLTNLLRKKFEFNKHRCPRCTEYLELKHFYPVTSKTRDKKIKSGYCRLCVREKNFEAYQRNPEKFRERKKYARRKHELKKRSEKNASKLPLEQSKLGVFETFS